MIEINIQKNLDFQSGVLPLELELTLEPKSFTILSGKSGSGKTSLLRMIAGFLAPDIGKIQVDSNTWFDDSRKINIPPQLRGVGYVFQDYALFPNMSVRQNLIYALNKGNDPAVIDELIELIELGDLQNSKPEILSGGQQQRIALARALVQKPSILLLDEPFAALDMEMRTKLQAYLTKIHREFKLITLMVSHDQSEILKMPDRVLILDQGKIISDNSPLELYRNTQPSGVLNLTVGVIELKKKDLGCFVYVLIEKDLIEIKIEESKFRELKIGDRLTLKSSDFNPTIQINK